MPCPPWPPIPARRASGAAARPPRSPRWPGGWPASSRASAGRPSSRDLYETVLDEVRGPGAIAERHSGLRPLYPARHDVRHRRQLHQGRLVHRGLSRGLHPPQAGRHGLRDRGAALHRPGAVHRLRCLRGGVPRRRNLLRLRAAGEVRVRARPQRRVLRRGGIHRRAHRRLMARVAIIGAGPAGAFAAAGLLRARGDVEVDLFERLPTPWGLLRGGVAPDHQEIKRLAATFDKQTLQRGCRFLGNVEVGVDVSHAELMRHYHAVVYATGAQTDKSLGIPGEDLPGSWAATEFVAWYNGHPDYRDLDFDLSGTRAVVIGNGNVAADVVRMLTLGPDELERTDVPDPALEALRASRIEEVVVLGRRGPAQAAFTSAEVRELGNLDGVDIRVNAGDVELDPVSRQWLDEEGTFTARKNVELL